MRRDVAQAQERRCELSHRRADLAEGQLGWSHGHLSREHPFGTMIYTNSCLHCMTVALAQSGEGLGAMWGRETAEQSFTEAAFRTLEVHELEHDRGTSITSAGRSPGAGSRTFVARYRAYPRSRPQW